MEPGTSDSGVGGQISGSTCLNSLEYKARLLDSLPNCIFLVDTEHKVQAANARAVTMLGVDEDEVIGSPIGELLHILELNDNRPLDIAPSLDRALSSGDAELVDAWCDHEADGHREEPHKVAVSIFPSSSGNESDSVTLVVAHGPFEQTYRLRDAVLSMVSHELRTPLLHIKGFVSTLLASDIEWDEATKLDFLHTIDREADRLTATVSDLMEISRMGSGDLPLHLELADPYLLAYSALDSSSLFAHKHQVTVDVPENLPEVRVDVLRIAGVFVNLIENAAKYSKEGTRITIGAEEQDGCIRFSVTDEGIGIPKSSYSRIFDMFYRGDLNGKRNSGAGGVSGNGLGLAVCKAVLDAHKGEIWVESVVGKGSTFFFTLPNIQPRNETTRKRPRRAVPAKPGVTGNRAGMQDSARSTRRRNLPVRD